MKNLNFEELKFKKYSDQTSINDIENYISNWLSKNNHSKIIIGTDSQSYKNNIIYSTVIAMFYSSMYKKNNQTVVSYDKGAHLVYCKNIIKKNIDTWTRLSLEAEYSLLVANKLKQRFSNEIEIHLDFNKDEFYKSNKLYQAYYGYIKSLGYVCKVKPESYIASCAADSIVK